MWPPAGRCGICVAGVESHGASLFHGLEHVERFWAADLAGGMTTIVIQTDITRADGKLVTRTTQTQSVL